MTDTERKALALVNELFRPLDDQYHTLDDAGFDEVCEALLHAIEQHEDFRQEVSDAIQSCMLGPVAEERLSPFIIAKPVDPLVDAMQDWWDTDGYASIETFRAAIEARGGRIVWEGE